MRYVGCSTKPRNAATPAAYRSARVARSRSRSSSGDAVRPPECRAVVREDDPAAQGLAVAVEQSHRKAVEVFDEAVRSGTRTTPARPVRLDPPEGAGEDGRGPTCHHSRRWPCASPPHALGQRQEREQDADDQQVLASGRLGQQTQAARDRTGEHRPAALLEARPRHAPRGLERLPARGESARRRFGMRRRPAARRRGIRFHPALVREPDLDPGVRVRLAHHVVAPDAPLGTHRDPLHVAGGNALRAQQHRRRRGEVLAVAGLLLEQELGQRVEGAEAADLQRVTVGRLQVAQGALDALPVRACVGRERGRELEHARVQPDGQPEVVRVRRGFPRPGVARDAVQPGDARVRRRGCRGRPGRAARRATPRASGGPGSADPNRRPARARAAPGSRPRPRATVRPRTARRAGRQARAAAARPRPDARADARSGARSPSAGRRTG